MTYSPRRGGRARSAAGGSGAWNGPRAATRARAPSCTWSVLIPDTRSSIGLSLKAESFTESVIREMTRLNLALHGPERAINFAQGFPDCDPDLRLLDAPTRALRGGYNQDATTREAPPLIIAIALKQTTAGTRTPHRRREVAVTY